MNWGQRTMEDNDVLDQDYGDTADALITLQDSAYAVGYRAGVEAAVAKLEQFAVIRKKWSGPGLRELAAEVRLGALAKRSGAHERETKERK